MLHGKYQIYGTQIKMDPETKNIYIHPIIGPDNVDERRAELGLSKLSEYLKTWQITWDLEQYKRDLPGLVEKYLKHN